MKYCPYCGEEMWDENASFCTECGKHIPAHSPKEIKQEHSDTAAERTAQTAPSTEDVLQEETSTEEEPNPNDGYDGYYDDVVPDDHGNIRTGVDKELLKKVAVLGISVVLIICACVAIMYIL